MSAGRQGRHVRAGRRHSPRWRSRITVRSDGDLEPVTGLMYTDPKTVSRTSGNINNTSLKDFLDYPIFHELEKAQNLCEIQQFRFFKTYLVEVAPSIKSAMKKKDWRKIAKLYNGHKYEENNYYTKMKEAYENYNKE